MKELRKELPVPEKTSFIVHSCHTPEFNQEWHCHNDYEMIWFIKGKGLAHIGNATCEFQPGDIFLLGSNLPHQFQPKTNECADVITIHFNEFSWGRDFLLLPECQLIKELLYKALAGLKFIGTTRIQIQELIKSLKSAKNGNRIILILQCLQTMTNREYVTVSTSTTTNYKENSDCIIKIFKYTNDTFRNHVTLPKIAATACMSVPSFCNYFKRQTNKTYITYLNEVRVDYACRQLLNTSKPITDIGYESGFNTIAHFHRQFFRLKNITPLQYRKKSGEINTK